MFGGAQFLRREAQISRRPATLVNAVGGSDESARGDQRGTAPSMGRSAATGHQRSHARQPLILGVDDRPPADWAGMAIVEVNCFSAPQGGGGSENQGATK